MSRFLKNHTSALLNVAECLTSLPVGEWASTEDLVNAGGGTNARKRASELRPNHGWDIERVSGRSLGIDTDLWYYRIKP